MSRRNFQIGAMTVAMMFATLGLSSRPAWGMTDGRYSVEILVDGVPRAEYTARGGSYVEALKGREYSIRLTNRTNERVAIALAVDGLNSIDARHTTAAAARKWILGPWESVTLDGWQTSGATARRFVFTTEPGSYGAWLGRTDDLGVISASVFRERRPIARPIPQWSGEPDRRRDAPLGSLGAPAPSREGAAAEAPADRAGEAGQKAAGRLSDEYAATGIGGEVSHPVEQVYFNQEASPAATLQVRYEFRDTLVRLGVLPDRPPCPDDPLARRERSRGFEGQQWAPDPWHPSCR